MLTPFAFVILREIPFAVLLGVFLYLAYASFSGIQLRKRIKLLFTPPKHHPDIHYVRKVWYSVLCIYSCKLCLRITVCLLSQVKTWKMNLYTIAQVVFILCLYGLKLSPAGMVYPLAIVLLIPIRMFMGKYIYTHKEMEAVRHRKFLHACLLTLFPPVQLNGEEDHPEDFDEVELEFPEYEESHVPY